MTKRSRDYPEWKKTIPVRLDLETLQLAESQISACEACDADQAEVPFDYVLDSVTGCDPETTDYVLTEPSFCPRCGAALRTGFWRWRTSEQGVRTLYVLPGTLVALKTATDEAAL